MKTTLLISSVLLAVSGVFSNPVPASVQQRDANADAPTVPDILNYALTLEHLENAFYHEGLSLFDNKAFKDAGMPSWERGRIVQIGQHESSHVKFLKGALGDGATKACEYSFGMTDVQSFVATSGALENVGVSAYSGAAQYLASNPSALTAAAVILSTEGRHAAWITAITESMAPWSGSFDVPLTGNQVITLASAFIKSCPSSNPKLPFTPFPKLTVNSKYSAGKQTTLTFDASKANGSPLYLALQTGLNTIFTPISNSKTVTLPQGLQGIVYASVSTDGKTLSDDSTMAGPAMLNFPFLSSASNP